MKSWSNSLQGVGSKFSGRCNQVGRGGVKGRPGLQDDSCQVYPTNNLAIGINLLLLLLLCHILFLILHKHQQHYLVNTTATSPTSSCSYSRTNSSKSSCSTTNSSASSSSTTDSSASSSTMTISTSSHHQWPNPPRRVPRDRPLGLRAHPAPKKKKRDLRRATRLTHWHEEEAQSTMFTSLHEGPKTFLSLTD